MDGVKSHEVINIGWGKKSLIKIIKTHEGINKIRDGVKTQGGKSWNEP